MAAYSLNIDQVMGWTYPQLRMMRQRRHTRVQDERRWELLLATGTLPPELFDGLWQSLGGEKLGLKNPDSPTNTESMSGAHSVDAEGNVVAPPGTPLLSDIALGKAAAPPLIPITSMKTKEIKETDGR